MLWSNEISRDLSLRWVSEGYPALQQPPVSLSCRNHRLAIRLRISSKRRQSIPLGARVWPNRLSHSRAHEQKSHLALHSVLKSIHKHRNGNFMIEISITGSTEGCHCENFCATGDENFISMTALPFRWILTWLVAILLPIEDLSYFKGNKQARCYCAHCISIANVAFKIWQSYPNDRGPTWNENANIGQ